jgi:DNA polymerase III epsilon subunit-like protein
MDDNIITFDSETTGLNWENNIIISLGAVDSKTGRRWSGECSIPIKKVLDFNANERMKNEFSEKSYQNNLLNMLGKINGFKKTWTKEKNVIKLIKMTPEEMSRWQSYDVPNPLPEQKEEGIYEKLSYTLSNNPDLIKIEMAGDNINIYVNDAIIDPKALMVNGYTREELFDENKKSALELLKEFLTFVKSCNADALGGFNTKFDLRMLYGMMFKVGINYFQDTGILPDSFYDYEEMFYTEIQNNPQFEKMRILININYPNNNGRYNEDPKKTTTWISMDKAVKYYGLPNEPRPHLAIGGAEYETEILYLMVYHKHFLSRLNYAQIPKDLQEYNIEMSKWKKSTKEFFKEMSQGY